MQNGEFGVAYASAAHAPQKRDEKTVGAGAARSHQQTFRRDEDGGAKIRRAVTQGRQLM
jgi:hypothetical protein